MMHFQQKLTVDLIWFVRAMTSVWQLVFSVCLFVWVEAKAKPPMVLIVARPRTGSSELCWSLHARLRSDDVRATCLGEFLHSPNLSRWDADQRRFCAHEVQTLHHPGALHRCLLASRDARLRVLTFFDCLQSLLMSSKLGGVASRLLFHQSCRTAEGQRTLTCPSLVR